MVFTLNPGMRYRAFPEGGEKEKVGVALKKLRDANFSPLTFYGVMLARVEAINSADEHVKRSWWKYSFHTATLAVTATRSQNELKVASGSPALLDLLQEETGLARDGSVLLPDSLYEQLPWRTLRELRLPVHLGTLGECLSNVVWNLLAEEDRPLLTEYWMAAYSVSKDVGGDTCGTDASLLFQKGASHLYQWVAGGREDCFAARCVPSSSEKGIVVGNVQRAADRA
jgi:hypothetical protein